MTAIATTCLHSSNYDVACRYTRVAQDREYMSRTSKDPRRACCRQGETSKDVGAVKQHPITETRSVAGHLIACGSRAASAC